MPTLRVEFLGLNAQAASALNIAKNLGLLTDTQVAANPTNAGIQSVIRSAFLTIGSFFYEFREATERLARAIHTGGDIGILTDTAISGQSTVAGLVGLCTAVDERLDAAYTRWSPKE